MAEVLKIKDWLDVLEGAQFRVIAVTGADHTGSVERIKDGITFSWDDQIMYKDKKDKILYFVGDYIHVSLYNQKLHPIEINDIVKI